MLEAGAGFVPVIFLAQEMENKKYRLWQRCLKQNYYLVWRLTKFYIEFIVATGGQDPLVGIPDPVERFEDFPGVSAGLLRSFREQGFTEPTPIQVTFIRIRKWSLKEVHGKMNVNPTVFFVFKCLACRI